MQMFFVTLWYVNSSIFFYVNLQFLFKFINKWYLQEQKQPLNFFVLFSLLGNGRMKFLINSCKIIKWTLLDRITDYVIIWLMWPIGQYLLGTITVSFPKQSIWLTFSFLIVIILDWLKLITISTVYTKN
jgi:hypothetical protein